jgi:catechol 2,3-dioxygenase-like lactoylglutathione lyase family enzyme
MISEPRATGTDLGLDSIVLFVSDLEASRAFYGQTLGLRALEAGPRAATYAAGPARLCLLPAAEHGVALQEGTDRSADITFMVDDFARCHETLSARGVRFSRTLEYVVGVTAHFSDPDGHWFSLYQPSEAALGWPSGEKLQALSSGMPGRHPGQAPGDDLADAFLAYVFLFFGDADVAEAFYSGTLELEAIEGGPCRRIRTSADRGVVKYDVGTTMLTTHHVEPDDDRFRVATAGSDGVAMAFGVDDLAAAADALSRRGIVFSGAPVETPIGRLARFTDPAGHVLLLREPAKPVERGVRPAMPAVAAAAG